MAEEGQRRKRSARSSCFRFPLDLLPPESIHPGLPAAERQETWAVPTKKKKKRKKKVCI